MTQKHTPAPPPESPRKRHAPVLHTGSPSAEKAPAPASDRPDPKIAHGWLHTARFLTTAPQLEFLPTHDFPEIAFVGRSNAGKSTCINTLTQQKRLAFASKTPGRTQSINLFALGKQGVTDAVLADLPGYGYAAVPREAKLRWQRVMGNYLMTRENLRAVVLLIDPRLGLTELDVAPAASARPRRRRRRLRRSALRWDAGPKLGWRPTTSVPGARHGLRRLRHAGGHGLRGIGVQQQQLHGSRRVQHGADCIQSGAFCGQCHRPPSG